MQHTRSGVSLGAIFMLGIGSFAGAARALPVALNFAGTFTDVTSSDPACDQVFDRADYSVRHDLFGPAGRTSVLKFTGKTPGGFLDQETFVGHLGGQGDLDYTQSITKAGATYDVHAAGMIAETGIYLEFKVDLKASACTATGIFSAGS